MRFGVFSDQHYGDEDRSDATDRYEQVDVSETVGFDSATPGERRVLHEALPAFR